MSETKVEIVAVKEVSAEMRHPKSCMCEICQPGSGMVYSPEGSSGAEQRIAALEEQLQIRDAEIHLLKESRAAAVSQEQSSRVECNELRSIVASAQERIMGLERRVDNQNSFIERFACCLDGLPINHIGGSLIDGARDAGSIRTIVDTLLKQLAKAHFENALLNKQLLAAIECRTELGIKLDAVKAELGDLTRDPIESANILATELKATRKQLAEAIVLELDLRKQLAEAQAACAEMRAYLVRAGGPIDAQNAQELRAEYARVLSSTCGQSLLAERDRLLAIPMYIVKEWEESKSWNVSTLLTMSREALKGQP